MDRPVPEHRDGIPPHLVRRQRRRHRWKVADKGTAERAFTLCTGLRFSVARPTEHCIWEERVSEWIRSNEEPRR